MKYMAQEKFGRYIGTARHKQNLIEGARDIAESLKIATRFNLRNPEKKIDLTQMIEAYEDILKQARSIT